MLALTIAAVVLYLPLITDSLANSLDSLWAEPWYFAGDWEMQIGRFMWVIIDKLKVGLVSTPFQTVIYFIMMAVSICLIGDLFNIRSKMVLFAGGVLFLSYPTITNALSYNFMIPCFGMAFVFAVISCYMTVMIKNRYLAIGSGSLFLSFAMGSYQAYSSVTVTVFLFYFIYKLISDDDFDFIDYIIRVSAVVILGGILYYLLCLVFLKIYNLSFAAYRGADAISFGGIILNLPNSIVNAYKDFYAYFFTDSIRNNAFRIIWANIPFLIGFTIWSLFEITTLFKKDKVKTILLIFALLAIPLALNFVDLIAVGNRINLLMAIGISMFLPLSLGIMYERAGDQKVKIVILIVAVFGIYGNANEILNDQIALKYGRQKTLAIADGIYSRLIAIDDVQSKTLFIFGQAAECPMFNQTRQFALANDYAKYGYFLTDDVNVFAAWPSIINEHYGYITEYLVEDDYYEFYSDNKEFIEAMPTFPSKSAIVERDGVIIVKIADSFGKMFAD